MLKQTFETKKNRKIKKVPKEIKLNIDMDSIPEDDIYGYYIMNRMESSNIFGLPMIGDFHDEYPDYIALFNHPAEYNTTDNTCVGFYIGDLYFDDIDGLYQAIIYKDIALLRYYKYRLQNIKYFIAPDYSSFGNFKECTLIHQLEKQTIVMGWLVLELNAIVYPNLTYGLKSSFEMCFKIIYKGSNVAISLKGCSIGDNAVLLKEAVKYYVDNNGPKAIIAYSVASDETTYDLLQYAINKGVNIYVIDNTLRLRNLRRLSNNG